MVLYTYRFRLYPNAEQEAFLKQEFGNMRYVYNYFLAYATEMYRKHKKPYNYLELSKQLTKLKKEKTFLQSSNSQSLQASLRHLDSAFKGFFEKRTGFPKFKKKGTDDSVVIPMQSNNIKIMELNDKYSLLKIPKLKSLIKFRKHREIFGKIKRVTIVRTSTNEYYVNILVEREIEAFESTNKSVGIDVGLKDFCTLSDGTKIINPRRFELQLKRIRRLHRSLSRKKKGSKNREKAKAKLARAYAKLANLRKDMLHKLSYTIVKQNDYIFVEDLNVKEMLQNKYLSRSIADASWRMFINFLEYKSKWYGKTFAKIDRFFPSTKKCSQCGFVKSEMKLYERVFRCPKCGLEIDRDLNASYNILQEGLRQLGMEQAEVMPTEGSQEPGEVGSQVYSASCA